MDICPSVSFSSVSIQSYAVQPAGPEVFEPQHYCFTQSALDTRFGLKNDIVRELAPAIPMSVQNLQQMHRTARNFVRHFPGEVMYAVKCNPDAAYLQAMYSEGVQRFDVASLYEVKHIRSLFPFAPLYFMHPIKAPEAIAEAYTNYRVRAFVLDTPEELEKILQANDYADDLELFVRISVPKGNVATDFSTKFGAKPDIAADLIRRTAAHSRKLGVSFHVGTQCTDVDVYKNAIAYSAQVIKDSGATVEVLDIGGGFPTALNTDTPPPAVIEYMDAVSQSLVDNGLGEMELLCEAGRGLVADAGSLVVRVEGRKGDLLYINDGTYGGLFEAGGAIGLPYPTRAVHRDAAKQSGETVAFRLAGPTCDSVDMMNGPFMLPENIEAGDWIVLDKLGAYGEVSRSNFNGFGAAHKTIIASDATAE